ncbi:hypothetical protein ACEPAI_7606 [Sanghuangporus weigelae]
MRIPPSLLCTTSFSNSSRFNVLRRNHLSIPKHAPASSSAHFGYFVNPLRHATPHHLAGAFSSPIVQSRRYHFRTSGNVRPKRRSEFNPKPHRSSNKPNRSKEPESENASRPFTEVPQPIPEDPLEPPGRVKGWPTPIITQYDVDKYLRPLYRRGWSIEYRRKKHEDGDRYSVPSLQLYFENLGWKEFFALGEFIAKLEKSEKVGSPTVKCTTSMFNFAILQHNVEWKYMDRAGLGFKSLHDLKLPLPSPVVLLLRTHTAALLRNSGANDIIEDRLVSKTIEGITLRDIRFAILIDAFLRQYNAEKSSRYPIMIRKRIDGLENANRPFRLDGLLTGAPHLFKPTVWRKRKRGPKELTDAEFYLGSDWSAVLDQAKAESEQV